MVGERISTLPAVSLPDVFASGLPYTPVDDLVGVPVEEHAHLSLAARDSHTVGYDLQYGDKKNFNLQDGPRLSPQATSNQSVYLVLFTLYCLFTIQKSILSAGCKNLCGLLSQGF